MKRWEELQSQTFTTQKLSILICKQLVFVFFYHMANLGLISTIDKAEEIGDGTYVPLCSIGRQNWTMKGKESMNIYVAGFS
ncbi:hypothetical protein, partial [Klebsiella pneumoniae]|uniref:hypothetical protein n=1 Tax=Klebsiella pneumoniae TaxID=573 RepID=UPI003008C37F